MQLNIQEIDDKTEEFSSIPVNKTTNSNAETQDTSINTEKKYWKKSQVHHSQKVQVEINTQTHHISQYLFLRIHIIALISAIIISPCQNCIFCNNLFTLCSLAQIFSTQTQPSQVTHNTENAQTNQRAFSIQKQDVIKFMTHKQFQMQQHQSFWFIKEPKYQQERSPHEILESTTLQTNCAEASFLNQNPRPKYFCIIV
ncbi:Hypothetical_protein [Hexamita inflata]|uniref:Hypothetical_protein n=1 Tax=Hexamita inflata TaxID=28002 RepID=A0AA86TUJ6_9EUKA|nr:Hypothetical protein HINF_LOCUS16904 [Hexamita inflata]